MKVVIVGAGINGVTAALELTCRGHKVTLIDPGPLPHPLAASTDISKAVRAAYGADKDYTELAQRAIALWRQWNLEPGEKLYHKVGFLFMRQREMRAGDFEWESYRLLQRRGDKVERIGPGELRTRFPAWNAERFPDGFIEFEAGFAESGRVVAALVKRAQRSGIEMRAGKFAGLDERSGHVKGIFIDGKGESHSGGFEVARRDPSTAPGMTEIERPASALRVTRLRADVVIMATGAWTPYALPFTKPFLRATGQSVFHLRPKKPELFAAERFPVFGADISSTGYYGFPLSRDGVVKVANHGPGREMSPDAAERLVTADEEGSLREFLSWSFPALADAEIMHRRLCFYCDTNDGNFWIARDPERTGLVIAAGDCGHGFKFAPVMGEIIADAVEGKENRLLEKFRWRPEVKAGTAKEAARQRVSS